MLMSAVSILTGWIPLIFGGMFAWMAGCLLWRFVPLRSKVQGAILAGIGVAGIMLGNQAGVAVDWQHVVAGNTGLISMLAAVSFLRLIAAPRQAQQNPPPTGRRSIWSTLLGVHFFGAVVNLPTVFIMARHMARDGNLQHDQYGVLVKGFAAAAFWSPFFAAMAAALTYAPGASLSLLLIFGAPLAAFALLSAAYQTQQVFSRAKNMPVHKFEGYPMNLAGLWLPAVLALVILLVHGWRPELSVLGLISLLAPVVTLITLLLRRRPVGRDLLSHIWVGLPAMHAELVLFLSAGVMAVGISGAVVAFEITLPFQHYGAIEAAMVLVALVALAIVGVHPIVGIGAAAAVITPLNPDPSLLASTFLAAWGIGIAVSPLSALNLAMQATYRIKAVEILRANYRFGAALLVFAGVLFTLHPGA